MLNCCWWVPSVDTCCCCHSLILGTKLIAWTEVVLNLVLLFSEGLIIENSEQNLKYSLGVDLTLEIVVLIASVLLLIGIYAIVNFALIVMEGYFVNELDTTVKVSVGLDVILEIVLTIASVFLIIGVYSEIMCFIKLWLMVDFVEMVITFFHIIIIVFELVMQSVELKLGLELLSQHLVIEGLGIYFFIVVFNYYEEETEF